MALVVCEELKNVELEEIIVGAGAPVAVKVVDGSLADMLLADPLLVDVLVAETSLADSVLVTLLGDTDRLSVDMSLAMEESASSANVSLVASGRINFLDRQRASYWKQILAV